MTGRRTDVRYSSRRWLRVREAVLRRDGEVCRVVPGCATRANVADHVRPARPGMSDAEFFDTANLRAACRAHNVGRALMGDGPAPADEGVVTGDYT